MTRGTFGAVIRARREELQITLRKFAASVGMSPTYLSKIERDEFPPPAESKIVAIAGALSMDPDELLGLAGRVPSDVARMIHEKPSQLSAVLRKVGRLPQKDLEKLLRELNRGSK